jgi:hypothetical protein
VQRRQRGQGGECFEMRKLIFSLALALILSVVMSVAPVLAHGPAGNVPCCF